MPDPESLWLPWKNPGIIIEPKCVIGEVAGKHQELQEEIQRFRG